MNIDRASEPASNKIVLYGPLHTARSHRMFVERSRDVRTIELGQFEDVHANEIAQLLDAASIQWWTKRAGPLVRILFAGDWGTRMFVDSSKLVEAQQIAKRVLEHRN